MELFRLASCGFTFTLFSLPTWSTVLATANESRFLPILPGFQSEPHKEPINLTISAFVCLLVLAAAVGNGILLFVVLHSKEHRHRSDLLIASFATADLLMCVLVFPLSLVYQLEGKWGFGDTICKFWIVMDVALCAVANYSMSAICMNVCFHVKHSFRWLHQFMHTWMHRVIASIWLISFLIGTLPLAFGYGLSQSENEYSICLLDEPKAHAVVVSIVVFLIPVIWTLYLYCELTRSVAYMRTEQADADLPKLTVPHHGLFTHTNYADAIVTLGAKLGIFFCSWTPYFVVKVLHPFCEQCENHTVSSIAIWLPYISSWVSPFIYGMLNKRVHDRMKDLCGCCKEKHEGLDLSPNELQLRQLQEVKDSKTSSSSDDLLSTSGETEVRCSNEFRNQTASTLEISSDLPLSWNKEDRNVKVLVNQKGTTEVRNRIAQLLKTVATKKQTTKHMPVSGNVHEGIQEFLDKNKGDGADDKNVLNPDKKFISSWHQSMCEYPTIDKEQNRKDTVVKIVPSKPKRHFHNHDLTGGISSLTFDMIKTSGSTHQQPEDDHHFNTSDDTSQEATEVTTSDGNTEAENSFWGSMTLQPRRKKHRKRPFRTSENSQKAKNSMDVTNSASDSSGTSFSTSPQGILASMLLASDFSANTICCTAQASDSSSVDTTSPQGILASIFLASDFSANTISCRAQASDSSSVDSEMHHEAFLASVEECQIMSGMGSSKMNVSSQDRNLSPNASPKSKTT